jgi:hypothetical protein
MGCLESYYTRCRKILCLTAKRRETPTAIRQRSWTSKILGSSGVRLFNPIAVDETKRIGRD